MVPEPELPDSVTPADLDTDVRRDLRGLQKETAEKVARHLVAAGLLVDEEPERALQHARYARRRASRIAVVREAAGIVAYHAGEWNEALGEFRAARRMGGGPGHVPVMADIERALGRPERALELTRGPEVRDLGQDERIELLIVAAGARRDLGELDAAVVGLQVAELDPKRRDPWSARLFYAYADNLLAAGRRAESVQWFVHAHDADTGEETDAAARIAELTGDELPGSGDDGLTIGMEDTPLESSPATSADRSGPDDTAPDDTAPDDTAVDHAAVVETGAEDMAPDNAAPEDTTPEGTVPAATAATGTAPDADTTPDAAVADTAESASAPGRGASAADEDDAPAADPVDRGDGQAEVLGVAAAEDAVAAPPTPDGPDAVQHPAEVDEPADSPDPPTEDPPTGDPASPADSDGDRR